MEIITHTKGFPRGIRTVKPEDVIICQSTVNADLAPRQTHEILTGDLVLVATMNNVTGEYEEILGRIVCNTDKRIFRVDRIKDTGENDYPNVETILTVKGAVIMGSNSNDRYGFCIDVTKNHYGSITYEAPYWFDLDCFIVLELKSYPHVVMKDGTVIHYQSYDNDIEINETGGVYIGTLIGINIEFPSVNAIKTLYSANDMSLEAEEEEESEDTQANGPHEELEKISHSVLGPESGRGEESKSPANDDPDFLSLLTDVEAAAADGNEI